MPGVIEDLVILPLGFNSAIEGDACSSLLGSSYTSILGGSS